MLKSNPPCSSLPHTTNPNQMKIYVLYKTYIFMFWRYFLYKNFYNTATRSFVFLLVLTLLLDFLHQLNIIRIAKKAKTIRLKDFKSNIYLEQKWWNILYFFTCWYRRSRVDRKTFGWVWSEMVVTPWSKENGWMNGWMNWADFFLIDTNSGKLKN